MLQALPLLSGGWGAEVSRAKGTACGPPRTWNPETCTLGVRAGHPSPGRPVLQSCSRVRRVRAAWVSSPSAVALLGSPCVSGVASCTHPLAWKEARQRVEAKEPLLRGSDALVPPWCRASVASVASAAGGRRISPALGSQLVAPAASAVALPTSSQHP